MHVEIFSIREPQDGESTSVLRHISAPILRKVEPVGSFFERFCKSGRVRAISTRSDHSLEVEEEEEANDIDDLEDNDDPNVIPKCDPKDWKEQDHYAILGLASLRLQASEEQIKRAYKKKVLRFHPDKRRAQGLSVQAGEEAYFACITKAYEILSNPKKRISFDSVDPTVDDDVPSAVKDPSKFISVFRPVFQRNARWSINKPVPDLGDETATFEDVNDFYSFWLDFESWREFSYLDEEDKSKGENRDERRWIEKQNKAERQKRRKEEVARIRQLVDTAYACDPRIVKFKDEEKQKKLAVKQAKQDAIAKVKAEENERKRQQQLEEERRQQEKDEEEKAQAAAAKKEKEEVKKVVKKERKRFRTLIKDFNYFTTNDSETLSRLEESDKLVEFLPIERLQKLNDVMTANGKSEESQRAFTAEVAYMNGELEAERVKEAAAAQKRAGHSADKERGAAGGWSEEEIQLLVKAVNLFPAGTGNRWEVVAAFINQHYPSKQHTAKDVLAQAKSFQKIDANQGQKEIANKQALDHMSKTQKATTKVDTSDISERYMSVGEQQADELGSNPAPWSAKEQKLLEQAMRTFGTDVPDRWDKIAEMIPSRTKKDCMKRYKELVDMVRAKKLAQATAGGK